MSAHASSDSTGEEPEPDDLAGFAGQPSARLRPGGGYRQLRSFQVATVVYDATVAFCDRFMDRPGCALITPATSPVSSPVASGRQAA